MQIQPHHIIKLQQRYTQAELANVFEVNERTIRRLKKTKPIPQKRGRKLKINGNDLDALRLHVNTVKITTQKALSRKFSCSQSTICRTLKRAGITYKKITYQATEQLRKENKEKIEKFTNITIPLLLQSQANIFFLDECSFHLNMAPRRGYYSKSSRLFYQRPANKGKHYTFIFLVQITNGKKVIHRKLIEGGMKTKEFHEFISSFNPPDNGKKNYLIMDNLSVHKARKSCQKLGLSTIGELLASKGIIPIYLPPYTPELNPVEKCFNIIRQYVESYQARSEEKLWLAIEEKMEFFQREDMTKYLDNSIKECLMKNNEVCSIIERHLESSLKKIFPDLVFIETNKEENEIRKGDELRGDFGEKWIVLEYEGSEIS